MVEGLQDLLVLQDRDLRLLKMQNELQSAPAEEKQIETRLNQQLTHFESLKSKARQIEADRKKLELEAAAKRDLQNRYRTQQLETRKNEEYQALSHEIARAEKEIGELDDRQIELMEALELAQREVNEEAARVEVYQKAAATKRSDLKAKVEIFSKEKGELLAEVATLERKIPPPLLSRYRRLFTSKKDAVVVPIVSETNCSGCHMKLTHQTILSARAAKELVSCENCGRFVYWPQG
jgi:predicted  nucleic acid-binding Zn-ribbon protein